MAWREVKRGRILKGWIKAILDPAHRTTLVIVASALIVLLSIIMVNCLHPGEPDQKVTSSTRSAETGAQGLIKDRDGSKITNKHARKRPPRPGQDVQTPQGPGQPEHPTLDHPVNWQKASMSIPYPDPGTVSDMKLVVSIDDQRLYVRSGLTTLYTMYASTGMDDSTPRGTFSIEPEHGTWFFNAQEGMGARYYTSFLNHGVFLFHSVPTDIHGAYIVDEANLLGIRPGSHGCVRLTVPDAQWIMEKVPVGTVVEIS